jgi:hypothetical protein
MRKISIIYKIASKRIGQSEIKSRKILSHPFAPSNSTQISKQAT